MSKDIELVIKVPKDEYERIKTYAIPETYAQYLIKHGVPLREHGRKFEEIVVEYPSEDICPYPEYKGKPYFSIKYEEDGKHIQGFGTYKPEVLSRFLQEYFITPANIKQKMRNKI